MTEDWPVRPAAKLFYAQEKAELEQLLAEESAAAPELELYLLRPPIVVGPHALGAKRLPGMQSVRRSPLPLPVLVPAIPLQLIHEQDVGRALVQCIVAAGPPGAYNISGDGLVTMADLAREFGLLPLAIPARPGTAAGRRRGPVAVPAAGRTVGRGRQPSGDHGHHEGPAASCTGNRSSPRPRRCATRSRGERRRASTCQRR